MSMNSLPDESAVADGMTIQQERAALRAAMLRCDALTRSLECELDRSTALNKAVDQHRKFLGWMGVVLCAISTVAVFRSTTMPDIAANGFGAVAWAGVAVLNFRGVRARA